MAMKTKRKLPMTISRFPSCSPDTAAAVVNGRSPGRRSNDRDVRRCLSEHPLVGPDKVPRRLAKDGAPAVLYSAPELFVPPAPAPRQIVRRADHVRKVEKRVTHREVAMPH